MTAPIRLGPLFLTQPIGSGGMGTVWHARHPEGVDVAVKVLKAEFAADAALLEAFRFEVRSVASLDHPGIVKVYDYGVVPEAAARASKGELTANSPWLAMEHAGGGTLAERPLARSWPELRDLLVQILDGLSHSHARDIVHRDLKPRNVLFHGDADGRVTLTDFGIAHALHRVSPSSAAAGTPGYMSPEQIRGEWRDTGPWTDLYALGCLVWRLVTGNPPFLGRNRIEVMRNQLEAPVPRLKAPFELPAGFEAWAQRLIQRDPSERFPYAADAAAALLALDWGEAGEATPPIPLDWRPRHPPTTIRPRGTGLALFILRPWPIVGREREQDELWSALRRVSSTRRTETLLLTGDPGIGKSRLARWLAERSLETGASVVLRARHDPEGRRSLVTAARNALRVRDLEPGAAWARIVKWVAQRGSTQPEDEAARLTGLLFPEASGTSGAPIVHLAAPTQRLATWLQLFDRLSMDRPLLLLVDDLHWADEALSVLTRLAGGDRPILVVGTLNPEMAPLERQADLQALLVAGGVRTLPLSRLSDVEQRQLVDAGVGLTPRVAERLVQRTAGNPLFAVRIVTDWARQGLLLPTSHGFDLREGAKIRLPASIRDHFAARIDPLERRSPVGALALEVLAIRGGQRVPEAEWQDACDEAGLPLGEHELQAISASGLAERIEGDDGVPRWSLDHALLKDALIGRASDGGRRRDHHLACARGLSRQTGFQAREQAILHLVEAGQRRQAVEALRALADDTLSHGRYPRLLKLLDLESRLLDQAGAPADAPARIYGLADRAAAKLAVDGDEAAVQLARDALTRACVTKDPALCARAARAALQAEELAHTLTPDLPLLADAERWCRQAGDTEGYRMVLRMRGNAYRRAGALDAAERELGRAVDEARDGRHPVEAARAWSALGEVLALRGQTAEAETMLREAQAVHAAAGQPVQAALLEAHLAGLARQGGDLIAALERARNAREALKQAQAPSWAADLQVGLARLARGEHVQARLELTEVARAAESAPQLALVARGALLACAALAGDWAAWDRHLADWKAIARDRVAVHADAAWPLEWAARRAVEAGQQERAREAYQLAVRRYGLVGDRLGIERIEKRVREIDLRL